MKCQQKTGLISQSVALLDTPACTYGEIQKAIEVAASRHGSDDESNKIKFSCSKIVENVAGFDN